MGVGVVVGEDVVGAGVGVEGVVVAEGRVLVTANNNTSQI